MRKSTTLIHYEHIIFPQTCDIWPLMIALILPLMVPPRPTDLLFEEIFSNLKCSDLLNMSPVILSVFPISDIPFFSPTFHCSHVKRLGLGRQSHCQNHPDILCKTSTSSTWSSNTSSTWPSNTSSSTSSTRPSKSLQIPFSILPFSSIVLLSD